VLSRNPNGTFQVRIRGQEETRTERDVAYMTGMNKPALDAHLDGATQTHLTRGQTPSGPPIWQGTARHGDYAEVLSRNPDGTFQVRLNGVERMGLVWDGRCGRDVGAPSKAWSLEDG